jgi:hypothetical protein
MVAAASLVGFFAWWGAKLPRRPIVATLAILIAALGMVCDFSGECSAVLRLPEHLPAVSTATANESWNDDVFVKIERDFTLLSAGAANGLYTLGGILLTLIAPGLPPWVRWMMWTTWAAGIGMTVAAVANHTGGMMVTTAILFPLLLCWVAWLGARWRPA